MGRQPLPEEYMPVAELGKRMGWGDLLIRNLLRQDSGRDVRWFPFVYSFENKETGTWTYRIHRKQFEAWNEARNTDSINLVATMTALLEQVTAQHQDREAV